MQKTIARKQFGKLRAWVGLVFKNRHIIAFLQNRERNISGTIIAFRGFLKGLLEGIKQENSDTFDVKMSR